MIYFDWAIQIPTIFNFIIDDYLFTSFATLISIIIVMKLSDLLYESKIKKLHSKSTIFDGYRIKKLVVKSLLRCKINNLFNSSDDFIKIIVTNNIVNKCTMRKKLNMRFRLCNKIRDRNYGLQVMKNVSDEEFRTMMRLNRASFELLLSKLRPIIESNFKIYGKNSSGSCISSSTKLYCTLRWLAGGSYIDICALFGVSKSAFFFMGGKELFGQLSMRWTKH